MKRLVDPWWRVRYTLVGGPLLDLPQKLLPCVEPSLVVDAVMVASVLVVGSELAMVSRLGLAVHWLCMWPRTVVGAMDCSLGCCWGCG